ncbi:amidohydrolase [Mangrovicoccus ximenensis]|uniref:amidohydrolase n=1 Tax=Mangrovicoccus ximenensis TaxID=1911570 RepID=UPI000D383284|nr:amidohydrolase [Mangrovicoccus ximenensis]
MTDLQQHFGAALPEIRGWRRAFHADPELSLGTARTAARIAELLGSFGCDAIFRDVGENAVVGVIRGKEGPGVIGLRADTDALPMQEQNGFGHASATPGRMHACGHDGHTAMLLGAARHLAAERSFPGTVVLIFQPGEEDATGSRAMIEAGLMERFGIQEVYSMHNWPGIEAGSFAIRQGPFFASTDHFDIVVTGRGGHGAKPHYTIDPVAAACDLVGSLQMIVSRNADPTLQAVISVTSFETSSTAYNIIPDQVHLRGTARTLDGGQQDMIERRMREVCEGAARQSGAEIAFDYRRKNPVVRNAPAQTEAARQAARAVSGGCAEAGYNLGGDDFAFMLEERPGAYILIGNGPSAAVHNPLYDFNDDIIPAGCAWWVALASERLAALAGAPEAV